MSEGCVVTVRGEVAAGELGYCQPHEHLCIERGSAAERSPSLVIDEPDRTAVDLRAFRAAGGSALADAQPLFAGRDAATLVRLSEACDVHIIASTGFHKLRYYRADDPLLALGEEELAELFVSEIREGMLLPAFSPQAAGAGDAPAFIAEAGRSGARAGVVKTALEPEYTELHGKLFGAAARAAAETGAPLMIHVDPGADPVGLADRLAAAGPGYGRLIFCHLDRAEPDLAVHRELASRGAYLEYDTIARYRYHGDEAEAAIIEEMVSSGYADRLLLSLDVTRERLRGYGGKPGLDHLLASFYPFLEERGVEAADLRLMSTVNPSAVLALAR
jgi:phosphotriesterase-related protein